eukprot:COSAG01_NODE_363_length_18113_cov_45.041690_16_plen_51_part_00
MAWSRYVSADIVHLGSPLFNQSWPWHKWADWPTPAGPADPARNQASKRPQ